jgi:hypothetical protein
MNTTASATPWLSSSSLLPGLILASISTTSPADTANPLSVDLGQSTRLKLEIFDRLRGEAVDWFGDVRIKDAVIDRNSNYGFMGNKFQLGLRLNHEDWLESFVQFQDTTLAAIPRGAVGLGARYYENSEHINQNSGFLRQGNLKLKHAGAWFSGGRQLYSDGAQGAASHKSLKWIQDNRLAQRLIGPVDYTHAGRSFDGGTLGYGTADYEISGFGFMPTQGGFDINGMDTITDINVAGITLNLRDGDFFGNTLGRLAWYTYNDTRPDVVVVDNSLTLPPTLGANISLHTIGGHLARIEPAGPGQFDGMVYGFGQFGDWQTQNQSAWAFGAELGYQLPELWASPWLRVGINSASGDSNRKNQTHGTFFQMLPTAWLYAQFPFYNMMNNQDVFVQMILKPDPTVTVRADFHSLSVNATEDLVYSSSGAGNTKLFGFLGMPTYGQSELANVTHVGVGWKPLDNLSINAFYAHAFGQSIIEGNYTGNQGDYGFLETTVTF